MKVKIEKLPKSEMELEIEVSSEELDKFVEKAYEHFGKELKIEGFRPGKVPKEIVEKKIPKEQILAEAGEIAVKEKYLEAIFEQKLEPISPPEVKVIKLALGNPFIFKAKFAILPKFELPDYKKIASKVLKKTVEVKDEEVEKALGELQKSRAKLSQIARPSKKGDFVEIEFSSLQIESGKKHKDGFLLGQGHLIPGFEEKLEGMSAGEEKSFSLKFPQKHFQQGLSDQEAQFTVKMESVKKMELPELNDEFIKSLGSFENLDALRKSIADGIKIEKENMEKQKTREEILKNIAKEVRLEIPNALIEAEKDHQLEEMKKYVASQFKISFEEYTKRVKKSEKELRDSFRVEEKIQNYLLLREISKKEKIEVKEEEVKAEIDKLLRQYPDVKTAEKDVDLNKMKSYYEEALKNEKVLKLLENCIS
ncbi:trigger factor [Patescibacteria group bacterium]